MTDFIHETLFRRDIEGRVRQFTMLYLFWGIAFNSRSLQNGMNSEEESMRNRRAPNHGVFAAHVNRMFRGNRTEHRECVSSESKTPTVTFLWKVRIQSDIMRSEADHVSYMTTYGDCSASGGKGTRVEPYLEQLCETLLECFENNSSRFPSDEAIMRSPRRNT
jgi:hypothetical protein